MKSRRNYWTWAPRDIAEEAATAFVVVGEDYVSEYPVNESGYSVITWVQDGAEHEMSVARAAYSYHYRHPTPDESVDHVAGLCRSRRCVKKSHLRLLPIEENSARMGAAEDWPPGECRRGHRLGDLWPCAACCDEIKTAKLMGRTNARIAAETGLSATTVQRLSVAEPKPRTRKTPVIFVPAEPIPREELLTPRQLQSLDVIRTGATLSEKGCRS